MALFIMIYHYYNWVFGKEVTPFFLKKLGIYGVEIFYILSGFTLGLVYSAEYFNKSGSLLSFYKKRIKRIYPLLIVVTIITFFAYYNFFSYYDLFLNVSGLFSLIEPSNYIASGTWSIGNEIVFYIFFPLLIKIFNWSKYVGFFIVIFFFFVSFFFAFYVLNQFSDFDKLWNIYVNPLNHFWFFIGGVYLSKFGQKFTFKNATSFVLIGVFFLLLFLTYNSNLPLGALLKSGRIFLSILCFPIVFLSYFLDFSNVYYLDNILQILGKISYSLYLLHPIVFKCVELIFKKNGFNFNSNILLFSICIILSIVVSKISYEKFEKRFI